MLKREIKIGHLKFNQKISKQQGNLENFQNFKVGKKNFCFDFNKYYISFFIYHVFSVVNKNQSRNYKIIFSMINILKYMTFDKMTKIKQML